jgi:hypothetical protein
MQDSLGGAAATMLICNVSPGSQSISETLSSLRFADRVKHVKNEANVINRTEVTKAQRFDVDPRVPTLQAQVIALQRALLESQRENLRLKEEKNERSALNRVTTTSGWCPHCDGPLGDVEV